MLPPPSEIMKMVIKAPEKNYSLKFSGPVMSQV
jgi:hypothetical protein